MRRAHLFELEDQPWFPPVLRDIVTDSLQFGMIRFGFYDAAAPLVKRLLVHMRTDEVVDLCSGGTGPWLRLRPMLAEGGHPGIGVTFTDKHVSEIGRRRIEALGDPRLRYSPRSVCATEVPPALDGVRTIFTGFHHFAPDDARRVLADAVRHRRAIGVFEFTERSAPSLAAAAMVPVTMMLITPFIRPMTWERLFWTYALPVAPLCNLWDGIVSSLRTYSPDELRALADSTGAKGYFWEAGRIEGRGLAGPLTYLIGAPESPSVRGR